MAVLAQYTIRSKQRYIFRTNRLTEITGASALIRDAFKMLFKAAEEAGLKTRRLSGEPEAFSLSGVLSSFEKGDIQMVDLFAGGGNDTVLFDSRDSFLEANRVFTKKLLDECPGMIPMCVGIDVGEDGYHYQADYQRLMTACEKEKNKMSSAVNVPPAPFAMLDRNVLQAVVSREQIGARNEWTAEELSKVKKEPAGNEGRLLDDLVTQHMEESLLAVVHADGNNMGQKIIHLLEGHQDSYDECITLMRKMTADTANAFSVAGRKAVEEKAEELKQSQDTGIRKASAFGVRWIISEGDDTLFICNARLAKDLTCAYLKAVSEAVPQQKELGTFSACAGICLFHSHYPWAYAYTFAEDACSLAKAHVHKTRAEEAWIDFHYIHSGLGQDLPELRKWQDTARCMARPWRVDREDDLYSIKKLDELAVLLKKQGITRTNLKSVGAAVETGDIYGLQELQRIYYRAPAFKEQLLKLFVTEDNALKAIYDLSEVYDLWYAGRDEE